MQLGHRHTAQPTHKAKDRMKRTLARRRLVQSRQQRALAKKRGEMTRTLPPT